jgi:YVTN family beta-propeller protein
VVAWTLVTLAAAMACDNGTDPADLPCGIGTAPLTGLSPHTSTRVPLAGSPFGVAVSSKDVAYVTRFQGAAVEEAQLPNLAFTRSIAVGVGPTDIAFDSRGALAYVTNQVSHSLGVIDVAAHAQRETIDVSGDPSAVLVRPDDEFAYVATNRDELVTVATDSRLVTQKWFMGEGSNSMAVCHSLLYVSTHDAGTVTELDLKTGLRRTFSVGGNPQGIVISPTGAELYVANEHLGTVQFWDVANNVSLGSVTITEPGSWLAQSPGDGRLYATTLRGSVFVIDPITRTKVDSFVLGGVGRHIAFNSTGTIAVVANESGWVDFLH